ncbi:MAG TPA: DUF2490 domain-containing protein [Cyclobacteriaceae bacterium]|nr:DUF2490 domain-containing protein [Cyclobacteriaceae bacterium]
MNKHLLLAILMMSLLCYESPAQQKNIETQNQTWFGYFSQTRFTKRSGLWLDLHLRLTNDFVTQKNLSILRTGYTYYVSDQVRLTAGYAYVTQYGLTPGTPNAPEHRIWQQIQWFDKKPGLNLMQWLRVEERYRTKISGGELTNNYNFNWRFRYNIALTFPLNGKTIEPKEPFVFLNDEIHINAGKSIVNNYFDQNRLAVGLGYQFTTHLNAQLGYMYVFQQKPSGHDYLSINAIRLFVFHNMDFRSSKE